MKKWKHPLWTYVKYAIAHPWHVVVLAGATIFGVANCSLLVLFSVFLVAEILLLGAVLPLGIFRKHVDDHLFRIEKSKASEKRASILLQLQNAHRHEVLTLENRIIDVDDRLKDFPDISAVIVQECRDLLGQYIKLAIQFHLISDSCRTTCTDLERQIGALNQTKEKSPDTLTVLRIAIAERRLETLTVTYKRMATISNQMSAISELIQLKTEQSILPVESNFQTIKLRIEDSNLTNELMEFAYVDDVDMDAITLGKA